jgi:hypothetical protein
VRGPALGAGVDLVAILLILKDERDILGGEKGGVRVVNDAAAPVPEEESAEVNTFGLTGGWGGSEFTGAHGKEPGSDEEISNDGRGAVTEERIWGSRGRVDAAEEPGCDRFLAVGRGVDVIEGSEEASDGWVQEVAVRDV